MTGQPAPPARRRAAAPRIPVSYTHLMAMGGGSSGSTTQGLAIVDIGGLTAGVLVALFMLPVYYALLSRKPKPEVA